MPDEVVYPKFQSTLLQEERHVDRTWSDHFFCISIHAPTRGATKSSLKWMISVYDFNPRSYKRSDYLFNFCCFYAFLSIHAPTRGATPNCRIFPSINSFNPRSYKRSDKTEMVKAVRWISFNPRSYKRSDTFVKGLKDAIKLSIHAPTRGATNASSTASADSIFQSTFLQEERQFLSFASGSYFYFQSTLLQEERQWFVNPEPLRTLLSIHAPTRGATICKIPPEIGLNTFNPRSYKRSDCGKW